MPVLHKLFQSLEICWDLSALWPNMINFYRSLCLKKNTYSVDVRGILQVSSLSIPLKFSIPILRVLFFLLFYFYLHVQLLRNVWVEIYYDFWIYVSLKYCQFFIYLEVMLSQAHKFGITICFWRFEPFIVMK